jgi:hypothetical protein
MKKDSESNEINQDTSVHTSPLHTLHFVVHKNYAKLLEPQKAKEALKHYQIAAEIDPSDLELWFKIGSLAKQSRLLDLGAKAFLKGIQLSFAQSPSSFVAMNTWGLQCLKNVIEVIADDPVMLCRFVSE